MKPDTVNQIDYLISQLGNDPKSEKIRSLLTDASKLASEQESLFDPAFKEDNFTLCEDGSMFLGDIQIYPEQIKACKNIVEVFEDYSPLLVAFPQQGKTGACIYLIWNFIRMCKESGRTWEVFYCIYIADNELRDIQTTKRIEKAIDDEIHIIHRAQYNKIKPENVDTRLIIVDECHWAIGKDKPFHNFMRRCGIEYEKPKTKWKNKNNFVLSVSATPYAQVIRGMIAKGTFFPVPLPLSDNYYGLLNNRGRLRQAEATVIEDQVTDFYKDVFREFLEACKDSCGYLVVRQKGIKVDILKEYSKDAAKVIDIYCDRHNIPEFDRRLNEIPKQPTVLIIRGIMRAGQTLSNTKYIKAWVELPGSNADNVTQSGVGRCSGYDKRIDNFPIYCNVTELDDIYNFYEDIYTGKTITRVGKGTYTKEPSDNRITFKIVLVNDFYELPEELRMKIDPKRLARGVRISTHNSQDLASAILSEGPRSQNTPNILIDGPNEHFIESWKTLLIKHPDCLGKTAYFIPTDFINRQIKATTFLKM